ncbi:SDR family oxidoreductase [Clostridium ganghwense]|uniref:dTDP-4-dehydrorhamnose reductase n=1 Tax=Clostridium ganghwense TaxID=312089 RepID=A0ABT4CLE9_9CLOT|nr:sugar nucleotide-binding protein [Clostridium ganghwense]MCY6369874.1 sugar nucleotide-binding protein [Clostridium ganghwense]
MKKILLTGGNGFFCSRFVKEYKDKYEILSLDKQQLDVTNELKVMSTIKEFNPDYVIHAAAIAVTDFCNEHPKLAHDINVKGSVYVAKACKEVGAKLVFISSEQVFNGNSESGPYTEEDTPIPDTVYGQNKLEAEGLLKEILDELWILRFTWLFGFPERNLNINSNILWNTISSMLKDEKVKAPVNEYRGMTYVQEVLENFENVFSMPYGTYHIGSKNNLSRYDIVKLILTKMGQEHRLDKLLQKDTEKYKEHPRDIRLNTEKATKAGLKFSNTEDAIKKCIRDYNLNFQ